MKKIFFAAFALVAFSTTQAQTARFGLKGGLNVSTLSGDIDEASPKIGAHVGGFVEIAITNKFAVQPELLLSLQGAKSSYAYYEPGYEYSTESKLHLTYLNVPVMAKFYVLPNLSLEAGPQIGFLVSAKNKYEEFENDNGFISRYSRTRSGSNDLKTVDAAFNIGASYYFNKNMFVGARFCIGLTSIDENGRFVRVDNGNGNVYRYNGLSVQNNVFQASFGYRF